MPNKKERYYLFNQSQAAEFLGIDRRTLVEKPFNTLKQGRGVFYDARDLLTYAIERAVAPYKKELAAMSEERTLESERLRLTAAQADAQELKNDVTRGQLIPPEILIPVIAKGINATAGILDSLPLNISRRHPEISSNGIDTIRREIAKAMNTMVAFNETSLPAIIDEVLRESM